MYNYKAIESVQGRDRDHVFKNNTNKFGMFFQWNRSYSVRLP